MSHNGLSELAEVLIRVTASASEMDDFCRRVVLDLPLEDFPSAALLYRVSETGELELIGRYGHEKKIQTAIPLSGAGACNLGSALRAKTPRLVRAIDVCTDEYHRYLFEVSSAACLCLVPIHRNESLFGMLLLMFRKDIRDDVRLVQESHLIQTSLESLLTGRWVHDASRDRGPLNTQDALARMSHRQLEVLNLLVEEKTSVQMARELHVSESTIKQELSRVFKTLGVRDRTQARLVYLTVLAGGLVSQERESVQS